MSDVQTSMVPGPGRGRRKASEIILKRHPSRIRQVEARRFYKLGGLLAIVAQTMGVFGLVLWVVALFGWHQLVFARYIPNFWMFAALFLALFAGVMVLSYKVLYPALISFNVNQAALHDSPFYEELLAIHDKIDAIQEQLRTRGKV
jgi:hypothetical protein